MGLSFCKNVKCGCFFVCGLCVLGMQILCSWLLFLQKVIYTFSVWRKLFTMQTTESVPRTATTSAGNRRRFPVGKLRIRWDFFAA